MSDTKSYEGFQLLQVPNLSKWECFMFGNRPGGHGIVYRPQEGRVPNAFVRFMMRVCFDCVWVKDGGTTPPSAFFVRNT